MLDTIHTLCDFIDVFLTAQLLQCKNIQRQFYPSLAITTFYTDTFAVISVEYKWDDTVK